MATLSWVFPKNVIIMRMEAAFIALLAVIVFIFSYYTYDQRGILGILAALIFIVVYILVQQGINAIRKVEEQYTVTSTHFQAVRKTGNKIKTEKVPLKHIHYHKLDHWFLGGYLLSRKGKHLLFFNTSRELKRFENFLLKHRFKKRK